MTADPRPAPPEHAAPRIVNSILDPDYDQGPPERADRDALIVNGSVATWRGTVGELPPARTPESAAGTAEACLAERFLRALESREVDIECMGTTVPYWNIYPALGRMLSTAGQKQTLREVIAEVLAAAPPLSVGATPSPETNV